MAEKRAVGHVLAEGGLLPRELPDNFTFRKVKEVLSGLEESDEEDARRAIAAAARLGVSGPLAVVTFVSHHLGGAHEAEVDRVEEGETGERFAVLVYPEGEVPIGLTNLPIGTGAGARLRYDPAGGDYTAA